MGRPSLPDAEKRAKGTFDPRYSSEERAVRRAENVIAFPAFEVVPPCIFPLEEEGQKLYDSLTRSLQEQGRLTVLSHAEASALCGAVSAQRQKMTDGANVPIGTFVKILERIDKLQRADVDRAYVGSTTADKPNKFAKNGFARKR